MSENSQSDIVFRRYDHNNHSQACLELFKEIGWFDRDSDRQRDNVALAFLKTSRSWVAELAGRVESLVCTGSGDFHYLQESLDLCPVTAAMTSTIVRRLQCATRITAEAIADAAEAGAQIAGLGVFEQGFYERLGFGVGPYEHWFDFDPSALKVGGPKRPARRLRAKDWKTVHSCLLTRMRGHGSCNVFHPELTHLEMAYDKKGFGLGYDQNGELTHHLWLYNEGGENGPLTVCWSAFRSYSQFLELLSLLKSIGDQFYLVKMQEPPGIQLQDFIEMPFKFQKMTRHARFECRARAEAYWQMRILDLKGCIGKTHLPGPPVRFNLELLDPISQFLPQRKGWRGIEGSYLVQIGEQSTIESGTEESTPTLRADVGAFTRMWMGALRASALALTDSFNGPEKLIRELDRVFQIPVPHTSWDF